MAYGDFTLETVIDRFGLRLSDSEPLFDDVPPFDVSPMLVESLDEGRPLFAGSRNVKSLGELIVTPILMEVLRRSQRRFALFSGNDFPVDAAQGLDGPVDFLICASRSQLMIQRPFLSVVCAAKDNLGNGYGPCIAQMLGSQRFNEMRAEPIGTVFGAVTSGGEWRFLKSVGNKVFVDRSVYFLSQLETVVGILSSILDQGPEIEL